jgi:hypothetical protein
MNKDYLGAQKKRIQCAGYVARYGENEEFKLYFPEEKGKQENYINTHIAETGCDDVQEIQMVQDRTTGGLF